MWNYNYEDLEFILPKLIFNVIVVKHQSSYVEFSIPKFDHVKYFR